MKFVPVLSFLLLLSLTSTAQSSGNGGISDELLGKMKASYKDTPADKALKNALAGTPINTLAINSDNASMMDTHFSDKVETKGITDQKQSGRCWLFTGLNVLRAQAIATHNLPELTLSQGYVFFYDQLEKANLFLQCVIDTRKKPADDREVDFLFSHPISDGGTFTGVADLVMKYGVVPANAFVETGCANSTSQMRTILSTTLRREGLLIRQAGNEREAVEIKENAMKDIYRILVLCLGNPPSSFEWTREDKSGKVVDTRTYTPQEFYREYFGNNLNDDYVMLMNDPGREYYKMYEIQYDRHVYDGHNWKYLNLPVGDIKEMAVASIKDNKAMYFSCDVGKCFSRKKGTLELANYDYESLFGVNLSMDKPSRVASKASGSSHAMTLIAVDLDKDSGKPVKWMVENSWGRDAGYKGCLIMSDEWFDNYMFRLVVERKFVPEHLAGYLNLKPILLPCWDPMFSEEE